MLLCRADTERKLTVTLASFLNPDTVVILDQEDVDDAEEEKDTDHFDCGFFYF